VVSLRFLGTGGARWVVAKQIRSSAGFWLRTGTTNVHVDPGPGALVRALALVPPCDPATLDAIVLSHKHLDHAGDVNAMIEAMCQGGWRPRGALCAPRDAVDEALDRRFRPLRLFDEPNDLGDERVVELREEQLVAHKELRDVGEIEVRTEVELMPGRLEVDAYREEVEVDHETVGATVTERSEPWEEDGVLIVPVYEERLVVTKRLILRERLRIRRARVTERQLFQDTLPRERLVVDDPQQNGLVSQSCPSGGQAPAREPSPTTAEPNASPTEGGFLEQLVRKALE